MSPASSPGREKKPYAIWSKMERKQISLEQLSDIYAFRIVVPEDEDCYRALGVVHSTWHAVPGRFKDYISNPKQNDYQSIHTTIVGPRHQRVELQIRTERMHSIAEYGVAAHALYKDQRLEWQRRSCRAQDTNAYRWLRHLVGMLLDGDNPEEFLEHTKLELFQDQVFCFTPKGRLIALPRGANPIDFAYAVHTDIGNTCVGAKINGRPMPLATELRNGDEVEIICSKAQLPPSAWQSLAVTGKARSAIRRATRDAVRAQYGKLGREILVRAFQRRGKTFSEETPRPGAWAPVAKDRRGGDGGGRAGRACLSRRRARRVPRGEDRRAAQAAAQGEAERRRLVRPRQGDGPQVPLAGIERQARAKDGPAGIPDQGLARRSAGELRRWRRRAGRPHRRHSQPGAGHHHLSDPRRGAEGLRRGARALDRRDLGHRRGQSAALPRQARRHRDERARQPRPGRDA